MRKVTVAATQMSCSSDITRNIEKATALVDAVNKEYFPVVPSPTELVTIQLENEQRIFVWHRIDME